MKKAIQLYDQATVLDNEYQWMMAAAMEFLGIEVKDLSQSSEVSMQVATNAVESEFKKRFIARVAEERDHKLKESYANMDKGDNSFLDEQAEKPVEFIPVEFLMVQVTGSNQFWLLINAAFRVLFFGTASFVFKKPLNISQVYFTKKNKE
jgi:hypothetical protein